MQNLNNFIFEKLHLDKDTKVNNNKDINDNIIGDLKIDLLNKYNIRFEGSHTAFISEGSNGKYILITLRNRKELIKPIMKFIDKNYKLEKPCSTNNMSIYIYPKYE